MRIDLNQSTNPKKFRCAICDVNSRDQRAFKAHLSGEQHDQEEKLWILDIIIIVSTVVF